MNLIITWGESEVRETPLKIDLRLTILIIELGIWSFLREAQVKSVARVTWDESVARETHVKSDLRN